jgi:hypothetical protein
MERKMFDTPVLPRLETILAEVRSGDLLVPLFQRPFVWGDDRRLNLLDSIVKGMPIGSLLVWRTHNRELRVFDQVGGVPLTGPSPGSEKVNYLIDGHQRISTLFGALYSGPREPTDDDTRWPLYYELTARERPAFRVAPRRGEPPEDWLPLHILLDGDKLFEFTQALREKGQKAQAREAEKLANIFRDYIIPIVPLVTDELDIVTDAFVRINSQGKGMSEAHMLRALTHLGTTDTDRHFREVRSRLEPLGWGKLDDQVLVNILKAELGLGVYASGVRGVVDKLKVNSRPLTRLPEVLHEAVLFLREVGVLGPDALPYAYQLVTLAALAAIREGSLSELGAQQRLKRWFWMTTYTEHFSGITGRGIKESIADLTGELSDGRPRTVVDSPPIEPLTELRLSTVRARAFLLFLAQMPRNAAGSRRRQQRLAADPRAVQRLVPSASGALPGNRVIGDPTELESLREAMEMGAVSAEMSDEYAIPQEALALLPNKDAFVEARGRILVAEERAFIEELGLTVAPG